MFQKDAFKLSIHRTLVRSEPRATHTNDGDLRFWPVIKKLWIFQI